MMEMTKPEMLTAEMAAELLTARGFPITPAGLRSKCARGDGPEFVIFGRTRLFEPEAVLQWARAQLRPRRYRATSDARDAVGAA